MKPIYDIKKLIDEDPKKLVENIKQEITNLRKYIILKYPFFFPLLKHLKVRLTNKIQTAGVDGKHLVINPYFFASLNSQDKIFVILHETLHLALRHYEKIQRKTYKKLYNIATDAIINEMLFSFNIKPHQLTNQIITKEIIEKLSQGTIKAFEVPKLSAEEIYFRLLRIVKDLDEYRETDEFIEGEGSSEKENESESEGSSEGSGKEKESKCKCGKRKDKQKQKEEKEKGEGGKEEIDEKLEFGEGEPSEDVIEDIYNFTKQFGVKPAEFEIIVEKLRKSRINWKQILKIELGKIFRTKVISDWRRINRKLPESLPGYRRYNDRDTAKELIVLLDISGSVVAEKNVLEQFFSEIWFIVQHFKTRLRIIAFDAVVQKDREIRNLEELKNFMNSIKGGGGTLPDNALKYVLEKMQFGKNKKIAIVMLSDGIFEVDKRLCDEVATKVTKAIYVYTINEHKEEFKKWVRVRLVV